MNIIKYRKVTHTVHNSDTVAQSGTITRNSFSKAAGNIPVFVYEK